MTPYTDTEKQRLALAIERTGAPIEFFLALFAAAKVPENASIDLAFARARHFLGRKLLPAIYLDKEQFPIVKSITDEVERETNNDPDYGDPGFLLESVARLRSEYLRVFGTECFVSPNISLADEIRLLERAIRTGKDYTYWPETDRD